MAESSVAEPASTGWPDETVGGAAALRVLNVLEEARLGGPQLRIVRVARTLAGTVETVVVMPRADSDALAGICEAEEVGYRRLPMTRLTRGAGGAARYLYRFPVEVAGLVRLIRAERPGVVHCNGALQIKPLLAAALARRPAVWHLNDTEMPRAVRWVFRVLHPLASAFVFASQRSKAYYGRLIWVRRAQYVIPAPVDTRQYAVRTERAADGRPVVAMVANLNRFKGIETFVEMAARVSRQRPDARFRVIGHKYPSQAAYIAEMEALCRARGLTNLSFAGPSQDTGAALADATVYVCSSRAESSPMSVWEAMSLGLPVVSTDVGDVRLHARHGEAGRIVPVGDADGLAEAVVELLNDPDQRTRMGRTAREIAERELDLEICADWHAQLYREITGGARGR